VASRPKHYTKDEWRTLQFAWVWAFKTMTGSPPEMMTLQADIGEAPIFRGQPLARSVVESLHADMDRVRKALRKDGRTALQGFADVADVLDRRADPHEAEGFKRAVLGFASQVVATLQGMLDDPGSQNASVEGQSLRDHLRAKIAEGEAAIGVIASSLRLSR
jgi:hypothetical protein